MFGISAEIGIAETGPAALASMAFLTVRLRLFPGGRESEHLPSAAVGRSSISLALKPASPLGCGEKP